ncbi:MAG: ABC transporter substrate-binding protein, partial [Promethearchaeota archaeon]
AYPDVWLLPDYQTIINQTQVLGEYTSRFVLNAPYVPLEGLLTSWTSFILSPTSTPENDFIDVLTGDLVGTGPFIYDSIAWEGTVPINVSLSANPHYWGGKPKIDKLFFRTITFDPNSGQFPMKQSLSSGEVHLAVNPYFNESVIDEFRSNSSFTVQEGISLTRQDWIVMNNRLINATMRKAISYAFNYSSAIELAPHLFKKPKSPIPEGILYHNTTGINIPYFNISMARQVLKDVNWNNTAGALPADGNVSAGNAWESLVTEGTPLATYNLTWRHGEGGGAYNFVLGNFTEDLRQIGVKLERVNVTPAQWWYQINELYIYHRNMYHFTFLDWTADYNDPSNVINVLYTNKRIGLNAGQVNDTQVQQWMDDALVETDPIVRGQLYYQIQKRLIEEIYPNIWFHHFLRTDVYVSNLRGWYPNGFKNLFKFVYFA